MAFLVGTFCNTYAKPIEMENLLYAFCREVLALDRAKGQMANWGIVKWEYIL